MAMGLSALSDCVDTQETQSKICVFYMNADMYSTYGMHLRICVYTGIVCKLVCAHVLVPYINSMHLYARVNAHAQVREHVSLCFILCM